MKKIIFSVIVTAMMMAMAGCGSSKDVPYYTNIDSVSLAASRGLYDARIMPKDELTITVNTTDPDAAVPFNLQVRNQLSGGKQISTGGGSLQGYRGQFRFHQFSRNREDTRQRSDQDGV